MSGLGVIVLAAGQGTRMKSSLPKVLHPVCGKPMALHVYNAAAALEPDVVAVVVGFGAEQVRAAFEGRNVRFVHQDELLGTADAVRRCEEALAGCERVVVLNGDSPLLTADVLSSRFRTEAGWAPVGLLDGQGDAPLAFLTAMVEDAGSMGRVRRDQHGAVTGIVEAADDSTRAGAAEINAGQYVFDARWLWEHLPKVPKSAKGEYYLTHLPAFAYDEGTPANGITADAAAGRGFDDRRGLAEAGRLMRQRILERHMLSGVTIIDPATTYIDADVALENDCTILPNCYLYGATHVATNAEIGPGTTLRNSVVGRDSRVESSVVEDSRIGERTSVGPFSHIRGGADVGDDCEVHNYAEIKNSRLARNVKMHHFSYLGDAEVGENTNIGAGTITCNYDGVNKNRTTIGRDVFVGSDSMLIAPVTLGDGSLTAAGSVVTRDVGPGERVAGVPAKPLPPKRTDGA